MCGDSAISIGLPYRHHFAIKGVFALLIFSIHRSGYAEQDHKQEKDEHGLPVAAR